MNFTNPSPLKTTDTERLHRIDRAKTQCANAPEFIAICGMFYFGQHEIVGDEDGIHTAGTDGETTYWNRDFVDNCTQKQLNCVLVHEMLHCAYRHMHSWVHLFETDPRRANMAADYMVNLKIAECDPAQRIVSWANIPKPAMWLYDTKYKDWDVKRIFASLPDQTQGGGSGGSGQGGGLDQHLQGKAKAMSPDEVRDMVQRVDTALRMSKNMQAMREAGKGSGGLQRDLDDLMETKIDWREVLAEFVNQHAKGADFSTYARPKRRFLASGVYLPTTYGNALDEVVVTVDTSGSIGQEELTMALSDVKAILGACQVHKLHIIYWDDGVAGHETYDLVDDSVVEKTQPKGGGGTAFAPTLAYMKKHGIKPTCMVTFTDGYIGDWGRDPGYPALWVISTNQKAPWGTTVEA